jgi:hypothetical protein
MPFSTIHWALKEQVFVVKQFVYNADNYNDNDDDDDLWTVQRTVGSDKTSNSFTSRVRNNSGDKLAQRRGWTNG